MAIENGLRICSLNCNGIVNKMKRLKLIKLLDDHQIDIAFLQETHASKKHAYSVELTSKKFEYIHNFASRSKSAGVLLMVRKNSRIQVSDIEMFGKDSRTIICTIEKEGRKFRCISVYAPNEPTIRFDYLQRVARETLLTTQTYENAILLGDFNSVLSAEGRKSGNTDFTTQTLNQIIVSNALNEVTDGYYTYHHPTNFQVKSKIDFIFANFVTGSARTVFPGFSDHRALILEIPFTKVEKGPGYWKLNASILEDPSFLDLAEEVIDNAALDFASYGDRELWEIMKIKLKDSAMAFSRAKAYNRNNSLKNKAILVETLRRNNPEDPEIQAIENEINSIAQSEIQGQIIRSKINWAEKGEKSTKFFLNLEKIRQKQNTISAVQHNNSIVTSTPEIMKALKEFYTNLYAQKKISFDDIHVFLESLKNKTLSQDDVSACESPLTYDDFKKVIANLKNQKSPGTDGFGPEFYKALWGPVSKYVMASYSESLKEGQLPTSQRMALLTILYKKGDLTLLTNYRPISLSNYDYKILAAALANRLQKVMPNIISPNQTAYLKGRFIGTNIRLVQDIIRTKNKGAIILIDFKKAFDCVSHDFMLQCISKMGFGETFIKWITVLYNKPMAAVKHSGFTTAKFQLFRGVRQGCPISCLLFNICVEFLDLHLRNSNIQGFWENGVHLLTSQYADDLAVFIKSTRDIPQVLEAISQFSEVSGLVINTSKSQIIPLGKGKFDSCGMSTSRAPIKYLGIYVGKNAQACDEANWNGRINHIKALIKSWKSRVLTAYGKILVIKNLLLSTVVHLLIHCTVSKERLKMLEKIFFKFIWPRDRVKRNTMIGSINDGGLNMVHLSSFVCKMRYTWALRFIHDSKLGAAWTIFPNQLISEFLPPDNLSVLSFDTALVKSPFTKFPTFYREIFEAFAKVNALNHRDKGTPLIDQSPAYNDQFFIMNNNVRNIICSKTLVSKYQLVNQLPYANGILDCSVVLDQGVPFHIVYQLAKALASKSLGVTSQAPSQIDPAAAYKLVKQISFIPPDPTRWLEAFPQLTNEKHALSFKLKVSNIKHKKLSYFNFRVLHKILGTRAIVSHFTEINPLCPICSVPADITHTLLRCKIAKMIWEKVWTHLHSSIEEIDIIFGTGDKNWDYAVSLVAFALHKFTSIMYDKQASQFTLANAVAILHHTAAMQCKIHLKMPKGARDLLDIIDVMSMTYSLPERDLEWGTQ